ncbi:MAG: hypothetical protein IIZ35_07010, partial [Clostridia bacterium]|nr:hypothetical protein [Clostridia bacterium]
TLEDVNSDLEHTDDYFDKAGKEAEESAEKASKWDKVKGIMTGVGTAVTAVATAVAAVGTAMVKASVDVGAYADEILETSSVTGIATQDLQAYKYAAELVDVSVDTISGSLTKATKSMTSAANGGKAAAEAYEKLGVSIKDGNGELRDSEDVFWDAIDALGQIENETERDATAMTIFGKSAKDLNPLIEAGSDAMKEYAAQAEEAGAILSDDQLMSAGAFDDSVKMLTQGADAAKNAIGLVLLPQLTDLATTGTDLLGTFTRGILDADGDMGKIGETIGDTLNKVVSTISAKLPDILAVAGSLAFTLLNGITKELPNIVSAVVAFIPDLVKGLLSAVPALLDAAIQCVNAILVAFSDPGMIADIVGAVVDLIPQVVDALIVGIPLLLDGATQFLSAIIEALPAVIDKLLAMLPTLITQLIEMFLRNRVAFLKMAIELFMGLVKAIPQVVKSLIRAIPQILTSLKDFLIGPGKELFSELWEQVKEIFSKAGEFFGETFKKAWEAIKNAFSKVGSWFGERWTDIKNAFGNVKSFFHDKFHEAWEAVKGVFSGVGKFFSGLWDEISGTFSQLGVKISNAISGAVTSGINGLISMVENTVNSAINIINGVIRLIQKIPGLSGIKELNNVNFGRLGQSAFPQNGKNQNAGPKGAQKMAKGGIVDKPTNIIAGEAGREAIIPLENNTQWIQKVAKQMTAQQGERMNYTDTVKAFKQALREVSVEINGEKAGEFVIDTVTRAVYA